MSTAAQTLQFFVHFFAVFTAALGSSALVYNETWTGRRTGCAGKPGRKVKESVPRTWYDSLPLPKMLPPGWFFAIVWFLLYVAQVFVIWGVTREDQQNNLEWQLVYGFFYAQLLTGVLWTATFYTAHRVRLAFVVLFLHLGLNVGGLVSLGLYPAVGTFTAVGNEWLLTSLILWCAYAFWLLLACGFNLAVWMKLDRLREKRGVDEEGDAYDDEETSTSTSDASSGEAMSPAYGAAPTAIVTGNSPSGLGGLSSKQLKQQAQPQRY